MRDLFDANCASKCGDSGAGSARGVKGLATMLDAARRLIAPSARSDVPAFMVMDVMAAAARIEAAGGRVIHMEVGQPAAAAPATAIAAARAALASGRLRYTETLGMPRAAHRTAPLRGVLVASPANPTGTMMTAQALADLIAAAEGEGIKFISDEIYHGLDYAFAAETAAGLSDSAVIINSFSKYFCMTGWRIGWVVAPEPLVRPLDRLQGNLAVSVPTLSQIAAEAAFDGRAEMEAVKHGYEENRRILLEGLPKAGFDKILPVDGAFYLYADVSRFSDDSLEFAQRMLAQTHVAATPGLDFDPLKGRHFIRFCYAGAGAGMHEAVERITTWLKS